MKTVLILFIFCMAPISGFSQLINCKKQLLQEINEARVNEGVRPVKYSWIYQLQCNRWAKIIRNRLTHNHSAHYIGEVVNHCYDHTLIIPYFLNSTPHKNILMGKSIKKVCLAVYTSKTPFGDKYATVVRTY